MPLSDKSIEIYYIYIYLVCAAMRAKQALIVIDIVYLLYIK